MLLSGLADNTLLHCKLPQVLTPKPQAPKAFVS